MPAALVEHLPNDYFDPQSAYLWLDVKVFTEWLTLHYQWSLPNTLWKPVTTISQTPPNDKRKRSPPIEVIDISDNESEPNPISKLAVPAKKRVRVVKDEDKEPVLIESSGPVANGKPDGAVIRITRQLVCQELVTLTTIPSCWSVPRPNKSVAYFLNLTADEREWKDSDGNLMSMAVIIKSPVSSFWFGRTNIFICNI
jgi:hypothetical protein